MIQYRAVLTQLCLRVQESTAAVVRVQLDSVELRNAPLHVVEGLAGAREVVRTEGDHPDVDMGEFAHVEQVRELPTGDGGATEAHAEGAPPSGCPLTRVPHASHV